jgi:hypothetical protein
MLPHPSGNGETAFPPLLNSNFLHMVVAHTIVHALASPHGEVLFETSIDSEDDAMSVWFVPNNNQGIKSIGIDYTITLTQKPHQTDRKTARKIWNHLIAMGWSPL